jgi:hypothetical protein
MKHKEIDQDELLLVVANRIGDIKGIRYELLMGASSQLKDSLEAHLKVWKTSKSPASIRKIVQSIYKKFNKDANQLLSESSIYTLTDCCCHQELLLNPMEIFNLCYEINKKLDNKEKNILIQELENRRAYFQGSREENSINSNCLLKHSANRQHKCIICMHLPVAYMLVLKGNKIILKKTSESYYTKLHHLNKAVNIASLELFEIISDLQSSPVCLIDGLLQALRYSNIQNKWIGKGEVFEQTDKLYPKNKEILFKNYYRKKLFIIQDSGYNYSHFDGFADYTQQFFNEVLKGLNICTPCGKKVDIGIKIDIFNPEKEFKAASERILKTDTSHVYEIRINTKILHYVRMYCNTFAIPNYNIIPWMNECSIGEKYREKNSSVKEMCVEYASMLCVYGILYHELSHIILGHNDYLEDVMGLNSLDELNDEKNQFTQDEILIRKAFEAEADRQSSQWLVAFFDNTLTSSKLGGFLNFPSRLHAFEFYIYAVSIIFRIIQDLTCRRSLIHPTPNERLLTFLFSLNKYLETHRMEEQHAIYNHAMKSSLNAGKKLTIENTHEPLHIILNAENLNFVDEVAENIGIGKYQLIFNMKPGKYSNPI